VRHAVRLSCTPFDAPPEHVPRVLDMLGSEEMLLWASDWPHWQYEGDEAIPTGMPASLLPKLLRGNALNTYQRLAEGVTA
jgi:predicted TIM-barrel fold metal-dependent hydrolase